MQQLLMAPTKNAQISSPVQATKIGQIITITCIGLQNSETATLQILDPISQTYVPYYIDGNQPTFSATNNVLGLDGAGAYNVSKSVTANPVGVFAQALDF